MADFTTLTTEIINTYTLWPQDFTLENYQKILKEYLIKNLINHE